MIHLVRFLVDNNGGEGKICAPDRVVAQVAVFVMRGWNSTSTELRLTLRQTSMFKVSI